GLPVGRRAPRVLVSSSRKAVMEDFAGHGHRPQMWWRYEGIPSGLRFNRDRERSTLWTAGLLEEAERIELERFWRAQFDRSLRPGFFVALSPDRYLDGTRAIRAHFRWLDLPPGLIKRWRVS